MKIVKPDHMFEGIHGNPDEYGNQCIRDIANIGRVCYKSECGGSLEDDKEFCRNLIKRGITLFLSIVECR